MATATQPPTIAPPAVAPGPGPLIRVLGVVLAIVKWIALIVLALLVALLVAIPLVGGPTPLIGALALAAIWLALLTLLVRPPRRVARGAAQFAAAFGFLLLGVTSVGLSQITAYTPPIVDAAGNPVPGSIATLETVTLNGTREWISIRGTSTANPVLLFLAGGPGGSQLGAGPTPWRAWRITSSSSTGSSPARASPSTPWTARP